MLHAGDVATYAPDLEGWSFKVWGQVDHPLELDWQRFASLPQATVTQDIHCVTRWSRFDTTFSGVEWATIRELIGQRPAAALRDRPRGGRVHHERPARRCSMRLVPSSRPTPTARRSPLSTAGRSGSSSPASTSGRARSGYAASSCVDHDRPGFWERYGYHNDADPWREQRYAF